MAGPVKAEPQQAPAQKTAERSATSEQTPEGHPLTPLSDIRALSRPMPSNGAPHQIRAVLNLQRTIGNRATGQLLRRTAAGRIQPKLTVGPAGDMYEREADAAADRVAAGKPVERLSRLPAGGLPQRTQRQLEAEEQETEEEGTDQAAGAEQNIQRLCSTCEEEAQRQVDEEEKPIQAKAGGEPELDALAAENAMARSGSGDPLAPNLQGQMEGSFGTDFSAVRVHAGPAAQEANQAINARAFTHGSDIYLGRGESATNTRLMAHELTHVIQQSGLNGKNESPTTGNAIHAHEQRASRAANSLMYQHLDTLSKVPVVRSASNPTIMRSVLFTSTMEICRRLLESRVFHISQGGIRVTANAAYERRGRPECSSADYHMTLNQKGRIFDSEYGTCEFPQGQIFSRQWKNLPAGDYNLTIWTNNTNPYCCLVGDIIIDQQSGLQGDSCTQPPPGPLQVMHLALDLAGLIPGVGVVADGANLIIYAAEGDWTNAGISAAALVPVIGGAAVVMRRGRQAVRVSGEVVEQMGRSRIASALRRARGSRGAAEVAEETGEGVTRRWFAQRNPTIADPSLPPGTGHTDRFGNMTISTAGSATDRALVRYHEQVHSFLSPRLNFLRNFRANLRMSAYQRSALLQYLEEALAETYAQLRVHGIRNIPNGIRFPIREGYVTLRAVVTEAAIGTVLFGGLTYGVYMWASQESAPETP